VVVGLAAFSGSFLASSFSALRESPRPPRPLSAAIHRVLCKRKPLGSKIFLMETNMITPEFLLTSLVVVLIPGTGVVYTINTGLMLKWRASVAAAVGCTLGIVPHILASVLGLSALLNMSGQVFSILKIAGSMYLLYLA
jgi:hypothetical protein